MSSHPLLKKGDTGRPVTALQRLLRAAKVRTDPTNGEFKLGTFRQVKVFQKRHHLRVDGEVGPATWTALHPYLMKDAYARWLLANGKVHLLPDPIRAAIVKNAWYGYYHGSEIVYSETRPIPHVWRFPMYTDCSGFATLCYQLAGAQDPNGFGYDGAGNTSTLMAHGRIIALGSLQPGDLIFYSSPDHVVVYVGAGKAISNGGDPGPNFIPIWYRTPAGARSYL
jgi:Putative peptidoglycan binding domain/NlpC/P60 family